MPSRLWRVTTEDKKLFLTFDDGPIPGLTEWVLDVLTQYDAKATFFCVGANVEKHQMILQRIVNEGHAVGNHTQNHLNGWETPLKTYVENVSLCQQSFQKQGQSTQLFRPPYGRLRWQQRQQLGDLKVVMWDVLSKDYVQTLAADTVLKESIKATQAGSIIVFHDNVKAEKNLRYALPRYIDHFQGLGYRFEKLN